MELVMTLLKIAFLIHIQKGDVNAKDPSVDSGAMIKDNELRTMLNTVLDQNRRLVLQNNRLQQVWLGMKQMCSAITMPTCDCSESKANVSLINETLVQNSGGNSESKANYKPKLLIISVKSSGLIANTNSTTVTLEVSYTATPNHTTDWIAIRTNDGGWRSSGNRRTNTLLGSQVYTSAVDLEQPQSVRTLFFRIFNEDEGVVARFNVKEVEKKQDDILVAPAEGLLKINTTTRAPTLDSDMNITAIINKSVENFGDFDDVEAYFVGLNESTIPPSAFEIFNFISDEISLSKLRRTNTTSNLIITLKQTCLQYGGILSIRIPYLESRSGMVQQLAYGPNIKIYAPETRAVVPYNSLAFFPLSKEITVFPPSQSLSCGVIGNPRPSVSILKITKGAQWQKLETESVIDDKYMHLVVVTLTSQQPQKTEGRYVCRASNGIRTIDATTKVTVLVPALFIEAKTGVTKNTSSIITISCKARGKPKPNLALRLYEEYGPDLVRSGLYPIKKSERDEFTSQVTLKISPIDDPDIHTVFCLSSQGGPDGAYEIYHKIDVYPGQEKENNWDLYQRIQELQAF